MAAALENRRHSGYLAGILFWSIATVAPAVAPAVDYAGDVFSLEIWKLIIPVDDDGDGIADEVHMPVLRNFEDPAYFHLSKTKDSIIFRVPAGNAGTGNTGFQWCGLRELVKKSETPAAWGSNDGRVHNMTISFAFNTPPVTNSRLIAAGIYSGEEEVISIGLEKGNVILARGGLDPLVLDEGYSPGEGIELMVIIDHGRIRVLKDLKEIEEWPLEQSGLHFRAGCEVQAESGSESELQASAEVEIRKLYVTHKP